MEAKTILLLLALLIDSIYGEIVTPSNRNVIVSQGESFYMNSRGDTEADCIWTFPNPANGKSNILSLKKNSTEYTSEARPTDWKYKWEGKDNKDCGIRIMTAVAADSGNWSYQGSASGVMVVTILAAPDVRGEGSEELVFDIPDDDETAPSEDISCIAKNGRPEPEVTFFLGDSKLAADLVTREYIEAGADKPLYDDMFSVKDTLNFTAVAEDDGQVLRCEYVSDAFTDELIEAGSHYASFNITVRARPATHNFKISGFSGGVVGEPTTISISFSSNPGPEEIRWYMHDLEWPINVENLTTIEARESFTSVNETRYEIFQVTQNGHVYTSTIGISELLDSDEGQSGYVYVKNTVGATNYTFTFENLDSGLSSGAVAGIVIGVLLGVAIIGGVGFMVMKKKKKGKKSKNLNASPGVNAQQRSIRSNVTLEVPPQTVGGQDNQGSEIDLS